ncbi:MAG: ATPase, partial [Bacteroidales bacterium]|nr:ATPase [Bacteroidales bacterium]
MSNFFNTLNLPTSVLFAGSFLIIIFIGSGLLMLPNATFQPISYFEALFTSVSAVCVTGLVVVDTASVFTPLGKSIILILIQIGGLGIMAFTGLFGYIFSGSASIKERLFLKDIFSGEKLSGMFKLLTKIILLTVIIEGIGAFLIYHSLSSQWGDKLSLSLFHSIS